MSLSFDNSEAGCMLFYDCHRSVPAPFLTKTYHLVNDPSTDEIVSWGHDHTTFVVWRPPEFARDLLPNYFKHNNFSSFVRQLNTYGFRKVVPDRWEFANDFFRRGERHLLCEIHRRKALQPASTGGNQQSRSLSPSTSVEDQAWGSSPISSPLPSPIPIHVVVPPPPPQQQQHHRISTTSTTTPTPLMSISDENERLRKDNNLLLSEVSRLRRLYEDTIHMIQHQFKGSSPDHFTTLVSSARTGAGCQSLDLTFQPTVMGITPTPARREELNRVELSVNASRQVPTNNNSNNNNPEFFGTTNAPATYPTFQDHHHPSLNTDSKQQQNHGSLIVPSSSNPSSATITELEASNRPLPVKLFGVPLRDASELRDASQSQLRDASRAGTKRRQPEVAWDVVNGDLVHGPHDRVFLRPPPRKCLGSSSEMRSELSSRPAPWLQICATRDEGVYI